MSDAAVSISWILPCATAIRGGIDVHKLASLGPAAFWSKSGWPVAVSYGWVKSIPRAKKLSLLGPILELSGNAVGAALYMISGETTKGADTRVQGVLPLPASAIPLRVEWPFANGVILYHLIAPLAFIPAYFSWTGL